MKKHAFIKIFLGLGLLATVGVILSEKAKPTQNREAKETSVSSSDFSNTKSNNDPTSLSDFDYTIDGDTLHLNRYNGKETSVVFSNVYNIDGTEYNITKLEGSMFLGRSVDTVIFKEGIKEISHAFFNSSKVEKLYIPVSFSYIYDDSLAYLSSSLKDIYYAGTQEQWNSIFTIYEAKSVSENLDSKNYEGAGQAIADKLNNAIGHSFDANNVTFHFEAKLDDLQ